MSLIAEIIKVITPTDDELMVARVVFGVGIVVSNIAVWRGVYLENDKFSEETKKSGWILLVCALAAEAACAALLLVVDTTIGKRQEYNIEALKASNLTQETALEKEKQKTSARP